MTSEVEFELPKVRRELRSAARMLSSRGLKIAYKWAAEMLVGLPTETKEERECQVPYPHSQIYDDSDDCPDSYFLAKSYFDAGEFSRAAHVLDKDKTATWNSKKLFFLRCYALYLAGEQTKADDTSDASDSPERIPAVNPNLRGLNLELSAEFAKGNLDGFLLYLWGVVLRELGLTPAEGSSRTVTPCEDLHASILTAPNALDVLILAVNVYPWNWSAWLDLSSLYTLGSKICDIPGGHLPITHGPGIDCGAAARGAVAWMADIFHAHVLLERHQAEEALRFLRALLPLFPTSMYLIGQEAMALYTMRAFQEAQQQFVYLRQEDPYRLDQMDAYSNIMFVQEDKAELSLLARSATRLDKYRPETCCIVGNYYSLRGRHELAIVSFKRALKLDPHFVSAWTLMGHEHVELKNTEAAIDAYRHAVEYNCRDYRAWYGLGQAYEIMQMFVFAMNYYKKATELRPYDCRMWCALGHCYERASRPTQAIRCYERGQANDDLEGIATSRLAQLYRSSGYKDKAAQQYMRHLEFVQNRGEGGEGGVEGSASAMTVEALLYVARHALQKGGKQQLTAAARCCEQLITLSGPERDEAAAMMADIRTRLAGSESVEEAEPTLLQSPQGAGYRSDHGVGGMTSFDSVGGGGDTFLMSPSNASSFGVNPGDTSEVSRETPRGSRGATPTNRPWL